MKRFWDKVEKSDDCWYWMASCTYLGYGQFWYEGKMRAAHRVSFFLHHGRWPESDLELNHICATRNCVRPDHLEEVTHHHNVVVSTSPIADNFWKTHCKNGHEFSTENTRWKKSGRECRTCSAEQKLRWQRSNRDSGKERGWFWAERTHCSQGHQYTQENTYLRGRGGRQCRKCMDRYRQAYRDKVSD